MYEPSRTHTPEVWEQDKYEPSRTRTPEVWEQDKYEPSRTRTPEVWEQDKYEPSRTRTPEVWERDKYEPCSCLVTNTVMHLLWGINLFLPHVYLFSICGSMCVCV